jgi:hypothetical protein
MKINSRINLRYLLKEKTIQVSSFQEKLFNDKELYNSIRDSIAFEVRNVIHEFKERDVNIHLSDKDCMSISKMAANNFLIDWISSER